MQPNNMRYGNRLVFFVLLFDVAYGFGLYTLNKSRKPNNIICSLHVEMTMVITELDGFQRRKTEVP